MKGCWWCSQKNRKEVRGGCEKLSTGQGDPSRLDELSQLFVVESDGDRESHDEDAL